MPQATIWIAGYLCQPAAAISTKSLCANSLIRPFELRDRSILPNQAIEIPCLTMSLQPNSLSIEARIHWMELFLPLPDDGVENAFPDEEACRQRLAELRWPEGPICPSCKFASSSPMSTRKTLLYLNCKAHFSLTLRTYLPGVRCVRLRFLAAELIISSYANSNEYSHLTGRLLGEQLGVSEITALSLRAKLTSELLSMDEILIRTAICGTLDTYIPNLVEDPEDCHLGLVHKVQARVRSDRSS